MVFMWVLGLIAWSICFVFGFMNSYGETSSLILSIALALAVLLIMGFVIFNLNKWAEGKGRASGTKELVSLLVYVIVSVATTVTGVAYFITFQTKVKDNVQKEAITRIKKVKNMFGFGDTDANSYESYINTMANKYEKSLSLEVADGKYLDSKEKERRIAKFREELTGESKYHDMLENEVGLFHNAEEVYKDGWLYACETAILNWFPWNVKQYVIDLETKSTQWRETLTNLSQQPAWMKNKTSERYEIDLDGETDEDINLETMIKSKDINNYGIVSVLLIVVMQFLMLFPYLRTKDWSRRGPQRYRGDAVIYNPDAASKVGRSNYSDKGDEIDSI